MEVLHRRLHVRSKVDGLYGHGLLNRVGQSCLDRQSLTNVNFLLFLLERRAASVGVGFNMKSNAWCFEGAFNGEILRLSGSKGGRYIKVHASMSVGMGRSCLCGACSTDDEQIGLPRPAGRYIPVPCLGSQLVIDNWCGYRYGRTLLMLNTRLFSFDIDLERLSPESPGTYTTSPLPRFPQSPLAPTKERLIGCMVLSHRPTNFAQPPPHSSTAWSVKSHW